MCWGWGGGGGVEHMHSDKHKPCALEAQRRQRSVLTVSQGRGLGGTSNMELQEATVRLCRRKGEGNVRGKGAGVERWVGHRD